jgi:uncharacterized protein YndB with AHSA1/START domain
MSTVTTEPIVREIRVEASPETLFGFFTEPEKMSRWLCETAVVDPRVGGVISQVHVGEQGERAGQRFRSTGEFVEVDFPSRVAYTWRWEDGEYATEESSLVEVTFIADGSATLVRLVHSGLPESARADHDAGWGMLLERLVAAATA